MNKEKSSFLSLLKTTEVTHWGNLRLKMLTNIRQVMDYQRRKQKLCGLAPTKSWDFEKGFPGRRAGYWHGGHLDTVYIPHINHC